MRFWGYDPARIRSILASEAWFPFSGWFLVAYCVLLVLVCCPIVIIQLKLGGKFKLGIVRIFSDHAPYLQGKPNRVLFFFLFFFRIPLNKTNCPLESQHRTKEGFPRLLHLITSQVQPQLLFWWLSSLLPVKALTWAKCFCICTPPWRSLLLGNLLPTCHQGRAIL